MARQTRPIIAINEETGERREFGGLYAASKVFGVNHVTVLLAVMAGQAVRGWRVYDVPEKIRERIKQMEQDIEMLEGVGKYNNQKSKRNA